MPMPTTRARSSPCSSGSKAGRPRRPEGRLTGPAGPGKLSILGPVRRPVAFRSAFPMPMSADDRRAHLTEAFPDADIAIEDLAGDGDHYRARIVSEAFRGLNRVRQHQLVYAALKGKMGGELHALALETSAPAEAG